MNNNIQRMKRVVWRLREMGHKFDHPLYGQLYSYNQVVKAIMQELGTDKRTIDGNLIVLKKLDYVRRLNRHQFKIIEN